MVSTDALKKFFTTCLSNDNNIRKHDLASGYYVAHDSQALITGLNDRELRRNEPVSNYIDGSMRVSI